MKELKTYAHLYLGCDVKKQYDDGPVVFGKLVGVTTSEVEPWETLAIVNLGQDIPFQEFYVEEIKLILRPLSDMTEEERKELWRMVFSDKLNSTRFNELALHFTGRTIFKDETTHYNRPRWIMMQGIERLAIEIDGTVWADCDLHNWRHNQHEVTKWLLLKSFDIFGLCDAGLAVSKTETKN